MPSVDQLRKAYRFTDRGHMRLRLPIYVSPLNEYVVFRLRRLMIKKRGRNPRAGQAQAWTKSGSNGHGLHRLRGTVPYPKAA